MAIEGALSPRRRANVEGMLCMGAVLILLPLSAYAIGLMGIIALYFVAVGGVALLYGTQLFLTRSASLPQSLKCGPDVPYSLNERHVLITGGSKGIGYAIALEAVNRRASLVTLVAREEAALQDAQNKCLKRADEIGATVSVQTVIADLLDPKAAIECLDVAVALKGCVKSSSACKNGGVRRQKEAPVEVFFCNAADVDPRPFCVMGASNISRTLALNMCTPFLQVRHILPSMIERGFGVICFSNTLAAFVPIYGLSTYSATKSALRTFAEAINQEVAGMGILVANVFLPNLNTPGYQREKQVRHKLTEILEETSKLRQPEEAAERLVNHLEAGHRVITVDFEGWACARLNAGFSRGGDGIFCVAVRSAESLASLLYEFILSGLFRVITLGLFLQFYSIIAREQPAAMRRVKLA